MRKNYNYTIQGNLALVDFTSPIATEKDSNSIKTKRKSTNGKVNALRTPEQIQMVKDYFLNYDNTVKSNNNSHGIRNYCLVTFGFNTALRASDILMFTIGEVVRNDGTIRDEVAINEKKTGKTKTVYLNSAIKEAIELYLSTLKDYNMDDFLFASNKRKFDETTQTYIQQPIGVRAYWRIMNQCGKDLGLDKENINLGTHSPRKTWVRSCLKQHAENPLIRMKVSEALNHSSEKITYTYADITADEEKDLFMTTIV